MIRDDLLVVENPDHETRDRLESQEVHTKIMGMIRTCGADKHCPCELVSCSNFAHEKALDGTLQLEISREEGGVDDYQK